MIGGGVDSEAYGSGFGMKYLWPRASCVKKPSSTSRWTVPISARQSELAPDTGQYKTSTLPPMMTQWSQQPTFDVLVARSSQFMVFSTSALLIHSLYVQCASSGFALCHSRKSATHSGSLIQLANFAFISGLASHGLHQSLFMCSTHIHGWYTS